MIKKKAIVEDKVVECRGKKYKFRIVNKIFLNRGVSCYYCNHILRNYCDRFKDPRNPSSNTMTFYNFCSDQDVSRSIKAIPVIEVNYD